MSDYNFENYPFPNEDEKNKDSANTAQPVEQEVKAETAQPAEQEVKAETAQPAEQEVKAETVQPAQPEVSRPAYVDPYADKESYRQQARVQNPYYRSVSAQSYTRPASTSPTQNSADLDDGFYHHSYRSATDQVRTGYTQPSATRVTPTNQWQSSANTQPPTHRKKKSGGLSKGGIAILLVVCVLISGLAGFGGSILASKLGQPQVEANDSNTMVIHKVDTESKVAGTENLVDKTTSEITAEVADTVVEITTEVMQTSSYYGQYVAQGAGSGVIISDDGYILTNNHVIEGASSIKVTTRDGDTYDATIKGLDAKVDIALLKIEAKDLPTAVFGDSSKLEVGSKAVIIGNPLGTLGGSVTEGIISALDRSIDIDGKTMHLIQTDASVNPGNSGGGMFNGQGELTGIVVAKSASEEIDNIGFVIPINNVLSILGDLKDYGYVRGRADTGMEFIDLSNQMYAWYYYGSNETGVYVSSITSGSNAEKAGFRKGDRIVSVDGTEIKSSTEIESAISEKSAGDKVSIVVSRNGKEATIELELDEEVPDNTRNNSGNSNGNSGDNGGGFPGGSNPGGGGNPFSGLW